MSQIAQQDHLYIDLGVQTDMFNPTVPLEVQKKLVECYKAGTIFDVILKYTADILDEVASIKIFGGYASFRNASYQQAENGNKTYAFYFGESLLIEIQEEDLDGGDGEGGNLNE